MVHCHRCGTAVDAERVGVRDVCPRCTAYLHCCRNCDFYAPGLSHDCREPIAEGVPDKEQGNFCDYFRPAAAARAPDEKPASASRAALDALFAKKAPRPGSA